jgi:hypothetical protein
MDMFVGSEEYQRILASIHIADREADTRYSSSGWPSIIVGDDTYILSGDIVFSPTPPKNAVYICFDRDENPVAYSESETHPKHWASVMEGKTYSVTRKGKPYCGRVVSGG